MKCFAAERSTYSATLTVPDDVPPTYVGNYVGIWWVLETKVAVRMARDLKAKTAVFVLAPFPEDPSYLLTNLPQQAKGNCALEFSLPTVVLKQGQILEGKLSVQAVRDTDVRELRVELRRVEAVFKGPLMIWDVVPEDSTVLATHFKLPGGLTQTYDVSFHVSSAHYQPTVATHAGVAFWELAAILDHGRSRKCSATQPLVIYNSEGRS